MSQRVKLILAGIVIVGVIGMISGIYMYNKPHADLTSQEADFVMPSSRLFSEFEADENSAMEKYANKVIEISGKVQEITTTGEGGTVLVLRGDEDMFGVNCAFEAQDAAAVEDLQTGQEITLRGLCAGMLMDVNLSRCVLIN